MNHADMEIRDARIIALRKQKLSVPQIAEQLGLTEGIVSYACKRYGYGGKLSNRKADYANMRHKQLDEDKAKNRINSIPGFEYAGGYTGTDGKCRIKCLNCGSEWEQNYQPIRKGSGISCPVCVERERKERDEIQRLEQEAAVIERMMVSYRAKIDEAKKKSKAKEKRIHQCPVCNKPTYSVCCSKDCMRRWTNHRHDVNRRAREVGALIDKDITLAELYKRDGGVCYLCGHDCDWTDSNWVGNQFIVGMAYPTIEHVVPLAKGGEHSWDNVRLSCFKCNTQKGAKLL